LKNHGISNRRFSSIFTPPLTKDQKRKREVTLWSVNDLNFSAGYGSDRKVRVVHSHEEWIETKIVGGKKTSQPQSSD